MSQNYVDTTITNSVIIGSSSYSDILSILTEGAIDVSTTVTGAPLRAVYAPFSQVKVSLTNFGTIIATTPSVATGAIGLDLLTSAFVTNYGMISGTGFGILLLGGGTVNNNGTILSQGTGLDDAGPAYLSNSGVIIGTRYGVIENSATLRNSGTIISSNFGVYVDQNSTLINNGYITGFNAVELAPGAYFVNSGTLGGLDATVFATGPATLEILPGAKFSNLVDDDVGQGKMILGGTIEGSIDFGDTLLGFGNITFLPGSKWNLEGNFSEFSSGQTITGFSTTDTLIVDGFTATSKIYVPGEGAILSNGQNSITIDLQGDFTSDEIIIVGTPNGTQITAPCFVEGTRITSEYGHIPVERLKIGDLVYCQDGGLKPIKWIGVRSYDGTLISRNRKSLPICIRQNAIADGVPIRDLFLSPDHSVCIAGKLVTAQRLVNGISIFQINQVESVSYYHIELEKHDVILAEGCPSETFLDVDCRSRFENFENYYELYPISVTDASSPCLPRLENEAELSAIQLHLIERVSFLFPDRRQGDLRGFIDEIGTDVIRGWAQDAITPDMPLILHIISNGMPIGMTFANLYRDDLREANLGAGYHGFVYNIPKAFRGLEFTIIWRRNDSSVQILPRGTYIVYQQICG